MAPPPHTQSVHTFDTHQLMTQERIRTLQCVFLTAVSISYVVVTMFMSHVLFTVLEHSYKEEMLRRVGYVTAMLEWLPSTETIAGLHQNSLHVVGGLHIAVHQNVTPDVESMRVDQIPPYTAYEYSDAMLSVVSVVNPMKVANAGLPPPLLVSGLSFMVLAAVFVVGFIQAANVVARRWSQHAWSRILVVLAFVTPTCLGALLVTAMTHLVRVTTHSTWKSETWLSAVLYSNVYKLVGSAFLGGAPLSLLKDTMNIMNQNFIADGSYSVHVVQYSNGTLNPPLTNGDLALQEMLLSPAAAVFQFSEVFSNRKVVATARLQLISALCAVIRVVENDFRLSWALSSLALAMIPPFACGIAVLLLFPFESLGEIRATGREESLWAWRTPSHWAHWKVFQGLLMCFLCFGMLLCYMYRIEKYSGEITALDINRAERLKAALRVAGVGSALLDNYVDIITYTSWNTSYLQFLDNTTEDVQLVESFYRSLIAVVGEARYDGESTAVAASRVSPDKLPLLMNRNDMQNFLQGYGNHPQIQDFEVAVRFWDFSMLRALLASDVNVLSGGCLQCAEKVLEIASFISPDAVPRVSSMITASISYAEEYSAIASAWARQTMNGLGIRRQLATSTGRRVVSMEEASVANLRTESPLPLESVYHEERISRLVIVCITATVTAVAISSISDYWFTAYFYGHSTPLATVRRAEWQQVPTNDYTTPRTHFTVNHHHLWKDVRRGSLAVSGMLLLCLIALVVVVVTEGWEQKRSLTAKRSQSQHGETLVISTVEYSAALWLRALLSKLPEDVERAIIAYSSWADSQVVGEDNVPLTTLDNSHKAMLELREALRFVSAIVSANSDENNALYNDFILHLQSMPLQQMRELVECLPTDDSILFAEAMEDYLCSMLYFRQDGLQANVQQAIFIDVLKRNPDCAVHQVGLLLYCTRLEGLLLRAGYHSTRASVAGRVRAAATAVESVSMLSKELKAVLMRTLTTSINHYFLFWGPIVLAWLCVPLLWVVHTASWNIFCSIYVQ